MGGPERKKREGKTSVKWALSKFTVPVFPSILKLFCDLREPSFSIEVTKITLTLQRKRKNIIYLDNLSEAFLNGPSHRFVAGFFKRERAPPYLSRRRPLRRPKEAPFSSLSPLTFSLLSLSFPFFLRHFLRDRRGQSSTAGAVWRRRERCGGSGGQELEREEKARGDHFMGVVGG